MDVIGFLEWMQTKYLKFQMILIGAFLKIKKLSLLTYRLLVQVHIFLELGFGIHIYPGIMTVKGMRLLS